MNRYCSSLSCSRNSIYSIHSSYLSSTLSASILQLFIFFYLVLHNYNVLLFTYSFISYHILMLLIFLLAVMLIWLLLSSWLNDVWIESCLSFTLVEQLAFIYGINLMIPSELMLFVGCFWAFINFSLILNVLSMLFCFPLCSTYSFAIPFSNSLIPVFSSLPFQATQTFLKIGFLINIIESLGQSLCCGVLFLVLQLKELLYSYFSLSDCMIGSIFYFTTMLHGLHVLLGRLGMFILLLFIHYTSSFFINHDFVHSGSLISLLFVDAGCIMNQAGWLFNDYCMNHLINASLSSFSDSNLFSLGSSFYIESSLSLFFVVYYRHFVDVIWLIVFILFFL